MLMSGRHHRNLYLSLYRYLCSISQKDRYYLYRCLNFNPLPSLIHLSTLGLRPPSTLRKIHFSSSSTFVNDWRYQYIRAKEIFIFYLIGFFILWEIKEKWSHDRYAFFMGSLHLLCDVGFYSLSQEKELFNNIVRPFSIRPYLIWTPNKFFQWTTTHRIPRIR